MGTPWMKVSAVMERLSLGLPDLIERHMAGYYGKKWFDRVANLEKPIAVPQKLRDPCFGLKVLVANTKTAFAGVFASPGVLDAAGVLRTARNQWAHFDLVDLSRVRMVESAADLLLEGLGAVRPSVEVVPAVESALGGLPVGTRDGLIARDFARFETLETLRRGQSMVPTGPGVYAVLRRSSARPAYLPQSPAGHFKGRDPSVSIQWLEEQWVEGAELLYLGQSTGLRRRIRQLIEFGSGKPVGHWGGRLVWQLADSGALEIGWRIADNPKTVEAGILTSFVAEYGQLPFANLVLGKSEESPDAVPGADSTESTSAETSPKQSRLTLHEAMKVVLSSRPTEWMTLTALADEIRDRHLYLRRTDGAPPAASQLGARARQYPQLFELRGGRLAMIRLFAP